MKRTCFLFVLSAALLSCPCVTWAQNTGKETKGLSHYLAVDVALCYMDGEIYETFSRRTGPEIGLGYRMVVPVAEKWSLIPGVGIHAESVAFGYSGPFLTIQSDLYFSAGYHFGFLGTGASFSLGPNLSYYILPDEYYIDADPHDARNGKRIYKNCNLSLRPEIMFEGQGRWIYGLGMTIGLFNQRNTYEEFTTYNSRAHYLRVILACRL